MLKHKILTHDVMEKRRINCDLKFVMCETATHLLFECPIAIATQVWNWISTKLNHPIMKRFHWNLMIQYHSLGMTLEEWRKRRFVCTRWFLWKQRNELIFRVRKIQPQQVVVSISQEVRLWARFCWVLVQEISQEVRIWASFLLSFTYWYRSMHISVWAVTHLGTFYLMQLATKNHGKKKKVKK